jgi:16S rRNA G966 N2-methylase RsmD
VGQLPLFDLPGSGHDEAADGAVSRAQALYGVHAYHTKVPPEAIAPHLLRHTRPGDLVADPFCGSGMTGVAARRVGRRAWLSDLSPAAVHIASNYTTPCEPRAYAAAAARVASACEDVVETLYGTRCHGCGGPATVAYVVWSDVRGCPACGASIRIWDYRSASLRRLTCTSCDASFAKADAALRGEEPVSVHLDCRQCGRQTRDPTSEDLTGAGRRRDDVPGWYPSVPFGPEREMWRRGHTDLGITSVADFYSPRNLWALSALWTSIAAEPDDRLRAALRFSFTAIANRASRRYQWNAKRPTNVLGGTLYIASLRYEFNVFGLWARKVRATTKFFAATLRDPGVALVAQASATALPLRDGAVDYCFTDPPFGANIVYSDCSLLWESWLGNLTDDRQEAIVTRHRKPQQGGKDLAAYAGLMSGAFREIRRILRPRAPATLVFQNTDPIVWDAVQEAVREAGFAVEDAGTLHKAQPSFKGIKAEQEGERVAATDVVLTLRAAAKISPLRRSRSVWEAIWPTVAGELERLEAASDRRRSTGHLFAVAMAAAMSEGLPTTEITFDRLDRWLSERCDFEDGWRLKERAHAAG